MNEVCLGVCNVRCVRTCVTFSVPMKRYAGTYKIHYHIYSLCSECTMYVYFVYISTQTIHTYITSDIL